MSANTYWGHLHTTTKLVMYLPTLPIQLYPPRMPIFITTETGVHQNRIRKHVCEKRKCEHAMQLLKQDLSIHRVSELSGVRQSTAMQIQKAINSNDNNSLCTLLNPVHHHARCIALEHEQPLAARKQDERLKLKHWDRLARRKQRFMRFPLSSNDAISSGGNYTFFSPQTNGTPRTRRFRQVMCLEDVLEFISFEYTSIFGTNRIWMYHETSALSQYPSNTRHPVLSKDCKTESTLSQQEPRVTASIVTSAAGSVTPLLMTVPKQKDTSSLLQPLSLDHFTIHSDNPHWLALNEWCPSEASFLVSQSGLTHRDNLPVVIDHVNDLIRIEVEESQPVLLLIHGHCTRNRITWLAGCEKYNMIVVLLPANRTDCSKPYTNYINNTFRQGVREVQDSLKKSCVENAGVALEVMLAVAGHRALTPDVVKKAFEEVRVWPRFGSSSSQVDAQTGSDSTQSGRSMKEEETLFYTELVDVYSHSVSATMLVERMRGICEEGLSPSLALKLMAIIMRSESSTDHVVSVRSLRGT